MIKRLYSFVFLVLILLPLFAFDDSLTKTEIKVNLCPSYLFDINTEKVTEKDKTIPSPIEKDSGIMMLYHSDSFEVYSVSGYYISYIFTENNSCTLSASIKSDLLVEGGSLNEENDKIPFEVDVTVNGSVKTLSSTNNNVVDIITIDGAKNVGDKSYGSFPITVKPVSGQESLKNKKTGFYKADIVLTVKEN